MDLSFKDPTTGLMTKFLNVLARLPNLRTLELLDVTHRNPITRALKLKYAKFPSIKELTVCDNCNDFVETCPNLESLTFRHGFEYNPEPLVLRGAGLKRVEGVSTFRSMSVERKLSKVPSDPR